MAMSVYVRDPDGNQVEIRTYAPAARAEAERLHPMARRSSVPGSRQR